MISNLKKQSQQLNKFEDYLVQIELKIKNQIGSLSEEHANLSKRIDKLKSKELSERESKGRFQQNDSICPLTLSAVDANIAKIINYQTSLEHEKQNIETQISNARKKLKQTENEKSYLVKKQLANLREIESDYEKSESYSLSLFMNFAKGSNHE